MVDLLLEDPNIQTVLAAGLKDDTVLQGYIAEVFRMLSQLIIVLALTELHSFRT